LLRTGKLLSSAFNKKFPFSSSFCRRIATGFSLPLYGHAGPAFFVLTAATAPAGVSVAHVSLLFFFVSFSLTKRPSEKKKLVVRWQTNAAGRSGCQMEAPLPVLGGAFHSLHPPLYDECFVSVNTRGCFYPWHTQPRGPSFFFFH
jgi:hypothetical protein